ncbi:MAG: hypothetical protein RLZZ383_1278, partial [Pseudomonadota bacterium]
MNRLILFGLGVTLAQPALAKPPAAKVAPTGPAAAPATDATTTAPPATSGPDRARPPEVVAPVPFVHPGAVRLIEEPGLIVDFVRVPEALDVAMDVTWRLGVRGLSKPTGREAAEAMATLWDIATTTREPAEV